MEDCRLLLNTIDKANDTNINNEKINLEEFLNTTCQVKLNKLFASITNEKKDINVRYNEFINMINMICKNNQQ